MSVSLADQYRGFAIHTSHEAKPADQSFASYDARTKLNGLPFQPDNAQSIYDHSHHGPLLPHPASQNNAYQDTQTPYMHAHQMPRPSFHYGYEYSPFRSTDKRKRSDSDDEGDGRRQLDHPFATRGSLLSLSIDGTSITDQSESTLFPGHEDISTSLPPTTHAYQPAFSLPVPQQHHHHRLPAQLLNAHDSLVTVSGGPPSVVGQPGMPEPAPRPRGPKLKFTPEEDALLVDLKEEKNLTWKQIADFFPGRTSGTLQVRYCTKLKAKDVVWTDEMLARLQRALSDYEHDKWRIVAAKVGNGFTPAACRERADHLPQYGHEHGHGREILQDREMYSSHQLSDVDTRGSIPRECAM
ncbi:hypothetical protein N7539_001493 [Penicillium diatomitis]|uniref:Myb-like domain-containing protein n=1 Tax=Penicillium diatomitis TaxID=2819901 RepID=A0A9W9XGS1_9EURO|nr:uncharacterized protein N7539_001493 [Penicillium diatomitis]KAJ5492747.1 hypothetical protein N7539_001493 [Penicillium diatomitis]